ncbi:MAG TPA: hypothetical protein VGL95_16670 [Acetobacteraceae bacterium]|jgi:predicted trehalose synthase
MTIMLARTYAALKAASVSDEQAQAAVEELGHMNDQFGGLGQAMQEMHVAMKSELAGVKAEVASVKTEVSRVTTEVANVKTEVAGAKAEVAYLRGRFDVLIWAVGINAAATIAILGVLLRH